MTGPKRSEGMLNEEHSNVIKDGDLLPRDCISTDQFECRAKGRIPGSNGKEDPNNIYSGGPVLVNNHRFITKCH